MKPLIIRRNTGKSKKTIEVPKLKAIYTYADPLEKQRMDRALTRNKRRK